MILLVVMAVLVASVPLAGGSLRAVARQPFRWIPMILAGTLVQLVVIEALPDTVPRLVAQGAHLFSYALAGAFVVGNWHLPGLPVVGFGGGLNLAAIAANGGVMPASPDAVATAGLEATEGFANSAPVADARLGFLGDIFAIPASVPLANVFSIGDVLLLVGLAVLLHRAGGSRLASRRRPVSVGPA